MDDKGGGLSSFVGVKEWNSAKAWGLAGYAAGASHGANDAAIITVIEEDQGEFASGVCGSEGRAVLGEEPVSIVGVRRAISVHQSEVPLESEPPEDIPRASTIVIVKFYEPILVTAGDDEVAVILGVDDGVTVGPVRIQRGTAGGFQVIEFIPGAGGLRNLNGII